MGRRRLYATNAERLRAWRQRKQGKATTPPPGQDQPTPRQDTFQEESPGVASASQDRQGKESRKVSHNGKTGGLSPEDRAKVDEFRARWEVFRSDALFAFDHLCWGNDQAGIIAAYKAAGTLRCEDGDRMLLAWLRWERTDWKPGCFKRILLTVPGLSKIDRMLFDIHPAWRFLVNAAGVGMVPGQIADRIASISGVVARMEAAGELPERRGRRRSGS
jgi:hypothetical protein